MGIVSTGQVARYPDIADIFPTNSSVNFTFDGSADLIAEILHVPVTGTISNVHYRINSVSSILATLRIELRTVDATTGLPNAAGTLYGSSTSITVVNPTTGNKTAAVNCTGANAGDLVAVVFDLSAYTSGSMTMVQRLGTGLVQTFPYTVLNTSGSSASAVNAFNCFALEYSGLFYPLEMPAVVGTPSATAVSNSGLTRAGNIFTTTFPMRACGIYVWGDLDGDCLFRLRLASDDSILATATYDKDVRGGTATGITELFFDSKATYTVLPGVSYYVLCEGNSATTSAPAFIQNIPSTNMLNQMPGGVACQGATYTSPNYTTSNLQRYGVGILYDGLWCPDNISGLHPIEEGICS